MKHYFTNEYVESNLQKIDVKFLDNCFVFNTDNGVFSKKNLDFGSRTLLTAVVNKKINGKVLDLGCGYGAIGIILASILDVDVDMVDVNKRAIHLCEMNIKENKLKRAKAFISDCYNGINDAYDYIITNPPIRAGKVKVYEMLFKAKEHLNKNGELIFVIRKEQGAKSVIKDISEVANIDILEKNKSFFVISCIFR